MCRPDPTRIGTAFGLLLISLWSPGCSIYEPQQCGFCLWDCKAGCPCHSSSHCSGNLVCGSDQVCAEPAGPGEPCRTDADCGTNLWCDESGACQPLGGAGAPCDESADCGSSLWCNLAIEKCEPRADVGGKCQETEQCLSPHWCNKETLTCTKALAQSSPCDDSEKCGQGMYCYDLSVDTDLSGCDRVGLDGAPCNYEEDCAGELVCYAEFEYAHNSICSPRGEYGYPCPSGDECAAGFRCDGQFFPTCCTIKLAGQRCWRDDECDAGLSCNMALGLVCAPWGLEGDPCDMNSDCTIGYYCAQDGTCMRCTSEIAHCGMVGYVGQPCNYGWNCEEGACNIFYAVPTCEWPPEQGELCSCIAPCGTGLRCGYAEYHLLCLPAAEGEACGLKFLDLLEQKADSLDSSTCAWLTEAYLSMLAPELSGKCLQEPATCIPDLGEPRYTLMVMIPCQEGLRCDVASDSPVCVEEGSE